jgi:hypothetical protein
MHPSHPAVLQIAPCSPFGNVAPESIVSFYRNARTRDFGYFCRDMQSAPENTTDDVVVLPWNHGEALATPSALHLVVAWVLDEPDRVGQVARIDRPCFLGRGHHAESDVPPIEFMEVRPGEVLSTPLLQPKPLSRRQLEFSPVNESCVHVDSVGKRQLFYNGMVTSTCEVQAGDVLLLEG